MSVAAASLFSEQEISLIQESVREAENLTSGEIRVHIESNTHDKDVMDRAADIFAKLDLQKTAQRNGVLFYLAIDDRKFAILGDMGINAVVQENFWDTVKENMQTLFREGKFTQGMILGIKMAGEKLAQNFPFMQDDVNELPDEISFS